MTGRQAGFLLNLPQSNILSHRLRPVGVINGLDGWFVLEAEGANFGALNLRLSEGDDKNSHATLSQKMDQRARPAKQRQLPHRTVEVSVTGGLADAFFVLLLIPPKATADDLIDMPQRWVIAKCFHARPVDDIGIGPEPGLHHGRRRKTMSQAHPLPEAVVERVIEIEDDAFDQRMNGGGPARFPGWHGGG